LQLSADVVLVATGSYPYRPPGVPFHDPRVYDSDTLLTLEEIPGTLLVIGGGGIGCEYACIFTALGTRGTRVEKRGGIAGGMDGEVAEALRAEMEANGVTFRLNDSVDSFGGGEDEVEVRLVSGATARAAAVLVSSGRCGQTGALGL